MTSLIAPGRAMLEVHRVLSSGHAATVEWSQSEGDGRYISQRPFEVSYRWRDGSPLEFGADGDAVLRRTSAFAFLGLAIPTFCHWHDEVVVKLPFAVTEADRRYWRKVLKSLLLERSRLTLEGAGPSLELRPLRSPTDPLRAALFFGGGIESTAALASLLERSPLLFATEGPGWMNNNTEANVSVKYALEDKLCDRFGLDLIRATTNARHVSYLPEPALHRLCTGVFHYWLGAAVEFRLGIGTLFISIESEAALMRHRGDISAKPSALFANWHDECPMLAPVFGWASKAELFAELKDSELLDYVYSCSHNTGKRWCGQCGKCFRVAEYCRMFGVPLERLGMDCTPDAWVGRSRRHRIYSLMADHLYPRPGGRTIKPWPLPMTELDLADLAELYFFETANARMEFGDDQLTIFPGGEGDAVVRFPHVRLEGQDRFLCGFSGSGDSTWNLGGAIKKQDGETVASWITEFSSPGEIPVEQTLPELFGDFTISLSARRLGGTDSAPPVWDVPRLVRGGE